MSLWEAKACRSCLTVKGKLEKIGDVSKRQYAAITGLQISENDGYPPFFCMECRHHIRKSLAFRRKSRRAHFVLKEIMTVRKQVSYSDIITVNRKKTNLESSLNFWVPNNNACYLITNGEGEEPQEELQKYDLQPPKYTRSYSTHLIDIKPDYEEPVIEIPVEKNQETDDVSDDVPTNDYLEPDSNIGNIDMTDVFKDLPDEEEEHKSEDDEPKQAKVKVSRSERYSVITVAYALTKFDLKPLTLNEQKEKMELRKKATAFALAPFKCSMCVTTYKTMTELLDHVKYHNSRHFDHECRVCKNKFTTVEELNIHIANCHMYEYTCRMCQSKCYSQSDAMKHLHKLACLERDGAQASRAKNKSNDELKSFTLSPMTQQMMYDVMALRGRPVRNKAEEESFSEESRYNCDICNAWFKVRGSMVIHMNNHHRYTYTCNICMEVFTVREQAILHGYTHKGKEQFACKLCGLEFDGEAKFRRHQKLEHNVTRIPCNVCGFSALHESALYKHQIGVHKYISVNDPMIGDPNHKCVQCGVQFKDRRALETHLVKMTHTGAENVQFACVPCRKIFENEVEAETHSITCMTVRRKYPRKCCYCSEMLTSSTEYRSHYSQMHPTLPYRYLNRNAICDVCGKTVLKACLATHLRTHAAGALSCRLCSALPPTPAARVAHVLAAHARCPYRCALCARRFRFRSDCKAHILKVHAPTMLYKCEFCSQEFSYFRHLKQHSESLHNLIIPPIRSKLQFKSKTKIFVYAHMKIHINEAERPMVEQTEVELVDYLEQKSKPVDYNDYFVFTSEADSQEIMEKRKKRHTKKVKSELDVAVANIPVQWPDQNVTFDPKSEKNEELKEGVKVEVKVEVKKKVKKGVKKEEKDEKVEVAQEMELDVEMPLEVIENEGSQYVMIDGEMYRVACEDEVE